MHLKTNRSMLPCVAPLTIQQRIGIIPLTDHKSRRRALHAPIDMVMLAIAKATDLPYIDEPIELWPRKTMILESGEEVPIPDY